MTDRPGSIVIAVFVSFAIHLALIIFYVPSEFDRSLDRQVDPIVVKLTANTRQKPKNIQIIPASRTVVADSNPVTSRELNPESVSRIVSREITTGMRARLPLESPAANRPLKNRGHSVEHRLAAVAGPLELKLEKSRSLHKPEPLLPAYSDQPYISVQKEHGNRVIVERVRSGPALTERRSVAVRVRPLTGPRGRSATEFRGRKISPVVHHIPADGTGSLQRERRTAVRKIAERQAGKSFRARKFTTRAASTSIVSVTHNNARLIDSKAVAGQIPKDSTSLPEVESSFPVRGEFDRLPVGVISIDREMAAGATETVPIIDTVKIVRATEVSENRSVSRPGDDAVLASYQLKLLNWVAAYKHYPRLAKRRHQEGTVRLYVVIDQSGRLIRHRIVEASGFKLLDDAAKSILIQASPFPAIPPEMNKHQLSIVLPIKFALL